MKFDLQKNCRAIVSKTEQSTIVRAIRSGLVNMIPVLIIGAFSLIIKTSSTSSTSCLH